MPVITRTANTVTSPDTSQGGSSSAITGVNASGFNDSASAASSDNGGTQTSRKTAKWSDFGAQVSGPIVKIELKYTWEWSWTANADLGILEEGSGSSDVSHFFGSDVGASGHAECAGPGPVHDNNSNNNSGSSSIVLPLNTNLSTLQVQTELFATAESGGPGSQASADGNMSAAVSNLRVVITTQDSPVIVMA